MLIPEDAKCEICKKGFTPEEENEYYSTQGKVYHRNCYEQLIQGMVSPIFPFSRENTLLIS